MAPVTSVVGAFRRHVALSKSATLKMQMSLLLGARASRAAASTLSTAEVDSNVDRRPVEDVVVVGAGVAGLATAACLGRLGIRVTVAEGGQQAQETRGTAAGTAGGGGEEGEADKKTHGGKAPPAHGGGAGGAGGAVVDPGVGIWTHGLACLEELGILRRLEEEGRYMGVAGYREAAGRWLAAPSQPLQEYASCEARNKPGTSGHGGRRDTGAGASVLFVRESKLIEALRSAVPEGTTFVCADAENISFRDRGGGGCDNGARGRGDTDSSRSSAGLRRGGTVSGRPHHRCGGASSVREGDGNGDGRGGDGDDPLAASAPNWTAGFDLLVGADGPDSFVRNEAMLRWLGAEAAGEAAPRRRGYVVYRGVCGGSESSAAAEAGGGGEERRGEEGWGLESFQTWGPGLRFASVPLAGDERMWFATVADGVSDGASGSGASPKPELASPSPSGGEEAKELLLRLFGGWHAPIPSLLRATEGAGIAREEARAMSRRGLRAAVAAGAAAQQAGWELALVGDAAHTLDPVLAQGAGVALEDAFFLAQHVKGINASATAAAVAAADRPEAVGTAGGGRAAAGGEEALGKALARYDAGRLERWGALNETLGQLERPGWLVRARDFWLARYVPPSLRSRAFDALMSASLSGGLAGAVTAAVGAATRTGVGGGGRGRFGGYRVPRL